MAEPSRDQPAFAWIMAHMDALRVEFADRWIICDASGFIASQTDLDELLRLVGDRSPDDLAIAYMRARSPPPDDPGAWNLEPPLVSPNYPMAGAYPQPLSSRAAES